MRAVRPREVKWLTKGHRAGKWYQDVTCSKPDSAARDLTQHTGPLAV